MVDLPAPDRPVSQTQRTADDFPGDLLKNMDEW
jgi:hypothetical protein